MALAARADNALRMGNDALARSLSERARSTLVLTGASEQATFSLDLTDAWLALRQGEAQQAKELFLKCLERQPGLNSSLQQSRLEAWTGLVQSETALSNFDAALHAQSALEADSDRTAGFGPRDLVAQQIVRSHLLMAAGRYREALDFDRSKERDCASILGSNDISCRRLKYNATMQALRLGWTEQVRAEVPSLEALVDDKAAPEGQAAALVQLFRAYFLLGMLKSHESVVGRIEALAESGDDVVVTPTRKTQALALLAEVEIRTGSVSQAQAWLLTALSREQRWGRIAVSAELAVTIRNLMGATALKQQARVEALKWFRQARALSDQTLGPTHTLSLLTSLNEAIALGQLGHVEEARALVQPALAPLREAFGPDAPIYRRILLLNARLSGPESDVRSVRKAAAPRPSQIGASDEANTDFFI